MYLEVTLRTWDSEGFSQKLLCKAMNYLDSFYSSAARSDAWESAGYAQERALAAYVLAWKISENTRRHVGHVASIIMAADKMNVSSLDRSVVGRMEMDLVSVLDCKVSSPSVRELAEAVDFYLRLVGSADASMCADLTMQIAQVLAIDEDIAGSVEPVSIVLVAAVLALPICDAPSATSVCVVQEICKMFDEPVNPESIVRLREACQGKLSSMLEQSRHEDAVAADGEKLLLATLRGNVAAVIRDTFVHARVQQPHLSGTIPGQVSRAQPASSSDSFVEVQPLDGRQKRTFDI
eukprot:TRINITY_DN14105_c2_g4_i2.p1 TRINITY_DN14105_c2_g4~~TRINITY_DN14105_c2_g4_i2.p1  ORF type:complete len:293 (+),score=62.90 TRINITY_DN14105_c2_g4_i2:97-975(+)